MSSPIFISYSSSDQKVAETICDALQSRGHACWIACRDIGPGENFQESIVKSIRSAKLMLLVFTSNANNSDEIKKELVLAGRHHVTVVPVRVEDVAPNDALAYEFATRQWIDLFKDWERDIERLAAQIKSIMADGAPDGDGAVATTIKSVPRAPVVKRAPLRRAVLLSLPVIALGIAGAYLYAWPVVGTLSPLSPSAPQSTAEERAWSESASLGTIQALKQYLDGFPNGSHVGEAQQRIRAVDDRAWADATGAGTIAALNRYLVQFSDGAHIAQAQRIITTLERQVAGQDPSPDTVRFDGTWLTTIACTTAAGAQGYTIQITSQVKDGVFHGQRGTEGKPDWLTVDGKIQIDGSAELYAQGLTNASAYTVGNAPPGTAYGYHIQARFEGTSATGSRVELRPCNFTAVKR